MKLKELHILLEELRTHKMRREVLLTRSKFENLNQDERNEWEILTNRIAEIEAMDA